MSWTDPDTLMTAPTDFLPAATVNAILENFNYLYATPQVAVRLTTSQSVADATTDVVSWEEAVWETPDTMWDLATPTKIVIPRDGVYSVCASMLWDSSTDGTKRALFIHVNGDATPRIGKQIAAVDPTEDTLAFDTNLAAGDELDMRVRQLSGAALNLLPTRTRMTVRWVGAPG